MKRMLAALFVLATLGLLALAGCGDNGDKKVTAEQVKKESKDAMDTAVAYTKQKQDELMAKVKAQYQEIEIDTAELMGKAKEKAAAGQVEAGKIYADLDAKQAVVKEKLEAVQNSTGEAWEKAKVELEEALENLKQAYQKAKSEMAG